MLIYGNYCQLLDCYFDRIEIPMELLGVLKSVWEEMIRIPLSIKYESLQLKSPMKNGIYYGLA